MSGLQRIRRDFNGAERELLQGEGGEVYMTSEQIGLALGYSGDPSEKIRKVYQRHSDELRDFKREFKLTRSPGEPRVTTAWKKEALYLFAMFSRTETAKDFRLWLTRTCRELEDGDKVLVSRAELEAHMRHVARLSESTAGMLTSLASIHGSSLARLGSLKRQHPELFGHDVGQKFFEFVEAVEDDVPTLPAELGGAS